MYSVRLLAVTMFLSLPLHASDPSQAVLRVLTNTAAGPACVDGSRLDDGTFESGYRIPFASTAQFVQRLTPPTYPATLKKVCACFTRDTNGASTLGFSVVVYDDDGPGGQPGTRLGSLSSSGTASFAGSFTDTDCAPLGLQIDSGTVYVGVDWNAAGTLGTFICSDESASTPRATMYQSASGGVTWTAVTPTARALGLRAEFDAATLCSASNTQLCLNKGRFAVTAKFKAGTDPEGTANVVKLTDETGYLWFFNSANVEAVVKVLDACALNGKFWVFAGGLTNVQVDLTVTDTQTTNSKTYRNPQGTAFKPIQDTEALPCQ